jgi:hypothetical protein
MRPGVFLPVETALTHEAAKSTGTGVFEGSGKKFFAKIL